MNRLQVETREEWRAWLAENYAAESEVWLIFHKKRSGVRSVSYEAAVEEALCFGWIDSLIKRLNDDRYARKFTPRSERSVWSELNKERARKMIREGRMTQAGLVLIRAAKVSGEWGLKRSKLHVCVQELPTELRDAFACEPRAEEAFQRLSPSYQKQYVLWIAAAKEPETRQRRTREAIRNLRRGERLGLK